MPLSLARPRAAGAVAAAGALAATAFLVIPDGAPERLATPDAVAAPAPAAVSEVPRSLTRHFGVLRRERTAADDLRGRTNGIPPSEYRAEHLRALAAAAPERGNAAPHASDAFIAPGHAGRLCLLVIPPGFDGPGGACVSGPEALAGAAISALDAGGGLSEVVGLVPDGVVRVRLDFGDSHAILPVVQNAYGAMIEGRPREVSYRHPSGRVQRVPFGG